MSILDHLERVAADASAAVAKDTADRFRDEYLFCLEYYLSETDTAGDVGDRLTDLFSTSVDIDGFFIVKYNAVGDNEFSSVGRTPYCRVDVFFNFSYTGDADALRFFSNVICTTDFLSRTSAKMGTVSSSVVRVILKRTDLNGDVSITLNEPMTKTGYQGIFGLYNGEDLKAVTTMLWMLRGRESDDPKRTYHEIKRIGWLNQNRYDLWHRYRTAHGWHYEYRFEEACPEESDAERYGRLYVGADKQHYTVFCYNADLKARTLRELALRIMIMRSFVRISHRNMHQMFCESRAIVIYTPASALSFCLAAAYHKERRWKMTANLDEMGVTDDYVHHLYDTHAIELDDDFGRMAETVTDLVNRTTATDIDAFIRERAMTDERYKDINIL